MKITKTNTNLDNITLPEKIYKYRDWEDPWHKRFLTKKEVFMASPSSFEDELDSNNILRYDLLSKDEVGELYLHFSKEENLYYNRKQHREHVRKWLKKSPIFNKDYLNKTSELHIKQYFEQEGVLSLTENWDNDEMWTKYANNNRGFCIEYDTKILFRFLGGGGKVVYTKKLPKILPEPFMTFDEIIMKRVYTKLNKWSFEEEYRTRKFWSVPVTDFDRQIKIPKEAITRIITGDKMSDINKKDILEKVVKHIGEIEIIDRKTLHNKVQS